jgi:pilus assembly protein CpaC
MMPVVASLLSALLALSIASAPCAVALAAPPASSEEMSLAVGENRTLSAEDVKSYSEGTPGIAEVRLTPNARQFVIVGKKPGSTTLLLIKKDDSELTLAINVFARAIQSVQDELNQLLDGTVGVRMRRVGSRFFIEGGVSSQAELDRIRHIAGLYEGQVESLVVLGGAAADRKINVRVDVYFVQYEKSKLMRAGINWPGSIGGAVIKSTFAFDFLANTTTQAIASIVDQPLPGLDLASNHGYAKVLKHATVIAANGSEATFQSGGSQNYPVNSGFSASIERITFGTEIKVLPRFDPSNREIEVKVDVDVSDLVPPVGDTVIPGQSTSNLTTLVSLKLGESLVLSGIRTQNERMSTSGLPWLSEIPVLGALFGSTGDEASEVEGAIFVVPGVVESVPQRAAEIIQRVLREYDAFEGDMDEVQPADLVPGYSASGREAG